MAALAASSQSSKGSLAETLNKALSAGLAKLGGLWDEIGTAPSDREAMIQSLQQKILAEITEAERSETTLRDNYISSFKKSCEEFNDKSIQLGKDETDIAPKSDGETLIEANDRANELLHTLNKEYKTVYALHEQRIETIASLHASLSGQDETAPAPFDCVGKELSNSRLRDLDDYIRARSEEKQKRVEARARCVHEIQELLHEMRMTWDGSSFDQSVQRLSISIDEGRYDDETDHGLTIGALAAISDRVSQLQGEKDQRVETIKGLASKIKALWIKLSIPEEEREAFFNQHDGLGTQEISACEAEFSRLIELKKERLKPMIEREREKISELFAKLHFSEAQRREFSEFTTPEELFTEATLDAHEAYSGKLEKQYELQAPIMEKLEKRELLLSYGKLLQEAKPKAFANSRMQRGWNQERIKHENGFKKTLPKLEYALLKRLEQWHKTHGTHLMYDGKNFHDVISESIANRENEYAMKRATIKKGAMEKYRGASHGGKRLLKSSRR